MEAERWKLRDEADRWVMSSEGGMENKEERKI
jgi:hypothetical protein